MKSSTPKIDLLEIIERYSSSPSLSQNQKQSILSFQEQINRILNPSKPDISALKKSNENSSLEKISPKTLNYIGNEGELLAQLILT